MQDTQRIVLRARGDSAAQAQASRRRGGLEFEPIQDHGPAQSSQLTSAPKIRGGEYGTIIATVLLATSQHTRRPFEDERKPIRSGYAIPYISMEEAQKKTMIEGSLTPSARLPLRIGTKDQSEWMP